MKSFNDYIEEYKNRLKNGDIQKAYKGLIKYMMDMKIYFSKKYPDYFVSGSLYHGYMDMTYFSFFPESLKRKKLKIAIVLVHEDVHFEVWLAGFNKQVQKKYWKLFKDSSWDKYHIPPDLKGIDAIVEHGLVENPDFNDLNDLSGQIEEGVLRFIEDIEEFLSSN